MVTSTTAASDMGSNVNQLTYPHGDTGVFRHTPQVFQSVPFIILYYLLYYTGSTGFVVFSTAIRQSSLKKR